MTYVFSDNYPTTRAPLQCVDTKYFDDEKSMPNNGIHKLDHTPVCLFEGIVYKIKVPEKSLNAVNSNNKDDVSAKEKQGIGKKIVHRNCQTWIVESADQLVEERIFRTLLRICTPSNTNPNCSY
ncbi:hypothetical protein UA08_01018 [Talaromyces atroroseus]|uniref:Uncharacterized protein n=1 Tax=Talaromyces atroroseus TaxID=1441469 RepID=A0A225APQ9_TALAT|nr:hypothetical protein UA08_01018 [Talaromyces atroroseus]OKL63622.1 hypothetical protein UA08_01018 [Talaromyces atroroseus]